MAERSDTFNGLFRKSARSYFKGSLELKEFEKLNPDRKYTKKYLDAILDEAKENNPEGSGKKGSK